MSPRKLPFKVLLNLCLLFLGLLFEGPLVIYAQDSAEDVQIVEEHKQEVHDTQDLEKLLKRYNTNSDQVIDDASKINTIQSNEETSEVSDSEINQMRPSEGLPNALESALDKRRVKSAKTPYVNKSFSEDIKLPLARFQKLSEAELLKLLKENTQDSKFGIYLEKFPRVKLLSVRLLKDPEAIPSAVKIIEDKDKLVWFGGVMLSTFLLAFLLERAMKKKDRSILGAITLYFVRLAIMTGLRLGIIMYFYRAELAPAMRVFSKTFFS